MERSSLGYVTPLLTVTEYKFCHNTGDYKLNFYTGLFISPSGISDHCGTVAGMVTQKGSMSTEGEAHQVSVLPYRCSICAPLVTQQMSIL
jgi:hypothetical protein